MGHLLRALGDMFTRLLGSCLGHAWEFFSRDVGWGVDSFGMFSEVDENVQEKHLLKSLKNYLNNQRNVING